MLTDVERQGFHVPEEGKVGANVLGDEQVLWEHVAMKFKVHRNGQTPDSRHRTLEIPNPRFSVLFGLRLSVPVHSLGL